MFNLFKKKPMSDETNSKKKVYLCETRKDAKGVESTLYITKTQQAEGNFYFSLTNEKKHATPLTAEEVKVVKAQNKNLEEA